MKQPMKKQWAVSLGFVVAVAGVAWADMNVLVIGSSESFASTGESGAVQEQAFSPDAIAGELQSILENDPAITGSVHVVVDDIYRTKTIDTAVGSAATSWTLNYRAHSLAQYYFWPEDRTNRLDNLGSALGTNWDYVVMMDDPYLLANMPGIHAEGVKLVAEAAATGGAQPILLGQWPATSSVFSTAHFNEISYRVGEGLDIPVVPGALAWDAVSNQDTSSSHPTPNGAYLAAAAIYSEIFEQSATVSDYTYDDALAAQAYSTVTNAASQTHFTGSFAVETPFSMKAVSSRQIDFNHTGSSSENGIMAGLEIAMDRCRVTGTKIWGLPTTWAAGVEHVEFNYGRGNSNFEDDKEYAVDNIYYGRSYGFPMQDESSTAAETMLYGIDKRYFSSGTYEDGTDMGIAYDMIRQGEISQDVRSIPIRLMWAKIHDISPELLPSRDAWHMSNYLDEASATFLYTLLSGRCPVGDEPATPDTDEWYRWVGRTVGYQTAWRMAHLQDRAPGFEVLPRETEAYTVGYNAAEPLTVRFLYAPRANVTVNISLSDPTRAAASPAQLIFTPENYNVEQTVTVSVLPGVETQTPSTVQFETVSDDPSFDDLADAWQYTFDYPNFAALPFAEDFESLADDEAIAGANGWTGSGTGLPTNYSAVYSGAQPLPESNHTRVLKAGSSNLLIEPGADLPGVWVDSMVQFGTGGDLDQFSISEKAQVWFGVDWDQQLNVYHAVDEGSTYSNGWTSLAQATIAEEEWVRLTVETSYATAEQSRSFFRVYLNSGNALSSAAAYLDRDDSAPAAGGTWFLCANQGTSGNRLSEVQLDRVLCDDVVLTTDTVAVGDALDRDSDGMPDWKEDIAGTDSTNSASLLEINGMNLIGNQLTFDWQAVSGKDYTVWFATNLTDAVWQEITNGISGVEPAVTATLEIENAAAGFIRIETE